MGTEIEVVRWSANDLEIMAKNVAKSRLFGLDEAQAYTLMLIAESEGIHPIKAVQRYHVIKGKPAMRADAMLADMQRRGWVVTWLTEINDPAKQEAAFKHATKCPDSKKVSFTIEDAKRAQLLSSDMYTKYPSNMLRSRLISNACRALDPEVVAGIYTPEEVVEMVKDEPDPRAASVNNNDTGHGSGAYASPETIQSFRKWRDALINEVDQKWLDHITDKSSGEVNQSAGDPFDPKNFVWQLSGHLLKWAKAKDLINAPDGITHNKREQYLATVWQRHGEALDVEAREYCRGLWKDANAKLKRVRQPGDDDDLAAQDEVLDAVAAESTP